MRRWTSHLDAYTAERIDHCVAGLRRRFGVEQLRDFEVQNLVQRLGGFQTTISTDDTVLIDAYHLTDRGAEVTLGLFEHQFAQRRHVARGYVETQTASALHEMVLVELPVDVGRVLIRPETLGDKVSEWFARREIDFTDYPRFSRRYYVLADDDERARRGLPGKFLAAVGEVDRIVIEINGSTLVAMQLRPMAEDDQSALAPLAFELRRAWGR